MKTKLNQILESGIICAVGGGIETQDQARSVIEALVEGGMVCFELMSGVPRNHELLSELKDTYPEKVFGIGTVLDTVSALNAIKAEADFLVSPYLNLEMIKVCRRYNVISCFGALTPTEILLGWEAGLDLVKVFPTNAMGGASYIRTLKGPLPKVRFVGAGGVRLEDVEKYFTAGASVLAVDEDLIVPQAILDGQYSLITQRAQDYCKILNNRPDEPAKY